MNKKLEIKELPIWDGDKLGHEGQANYLTKYLTNRYSVNKENDTGFVLSLNAGWGFGKTFLLKNWKRQLAHQGFPTVYFDAWSNDFTAEPLLAFISELDKALQPYFSKIPVLRKAWAKVIVQGKKLMKPAALGALEILLKKATGISPKEFINALTMEDDDEENGDSTIEGTTNTKNDKTIEEIGKKLKKIFEDSLKSHSDKKDAISNFKSALQQLVDTLEKESTIELPIFILVDELDRCRPSYAIELLEGIKHLFGIRGIYFVVATNLRQLAESTRAIYGPNFNGETYLKRFFDIDYNLPVPNNFAVAKYLMGKSSIISQYKGLHCGLDTSIYAEPEAVTFAFYAEYFGLSLRCQEQVIRKVEAALLTANQSHIIHAHFLFFLACLHQHSASAFDQLRAYGIHLKGAESTPNIQQTIQQTRINTVEFNYYTSPNSDFSRMNIERIMWMYLRYSEYIHSDFNDLLDQLANDPSQFPRAMVRPLISTMAHSSREENPLKAYWRMVQQAGNFD